MRSGGGFGRLVVVVVVACAFVALTPLSASAASGREPKHVALTFVDRSRTQDDPTGARSAPVRTLVTDVYIPRGKGPFPLVLFAHGNAGNPGKLTQLLSAWGRAGYVVVAPTFPLTNDLDGATAVTIDFKNQPQDVRFVLDRALRENRRKSSPLHARIDPRRIGLAGHSLGGGTAYAVAFNGCCRDRRIDAVIAMDAVKLPFDGSYRFRGKPLLLIHLVKDPVVPFATSEAIYTAASPPRYLMALQQGVHFEPYEDVPNPHDQAVIAATTAFWNAYVKHHDGHGKRVIRAGTQAGLSTVSAKLR